MQSSWDFPVKPIICLYLQVFIWGSSELVQIVGRNCSDRDFHGEDTGTIVRLVTEPRFICITRTVKGSSQ
jgi:hypothetical protein